MMRRSCLILTLLLLLAPLASTIGVLRDGETRDSIALTNGWGESLAGTTLTHAGLDWTVRPERGLDDWVKTSIENLSLSFEDIDVAIGPDQMVKACAYNVSGGDLEMFTFAADGSTTHVVVDSDGDVGRGCSIYVDYRGFARIAYLDVDASSLKVVRENDYTPWPDDDWLLRTLVNDVNITTSPEIAMYSNGTEAIAYRDSDTGALHLMRFTGSWWRHTEMMPAGVAADLVLNIDVDDVLHLSFLDTLNDRVAVISLDGDARTFSVVDEGEGIGQPLGHHLDATGRAQLVYGIENGLGLRIVRDLLGRDDGRISPTPFFVIESNETTGFGTDANANGDFNRDGFSDLVYGEPGAANDTGAVHVHYGSVDGYSAVPDMSFVGAHPGARFGASLSPVGDVNGDGYDDLLIGAPGENNDSGDATGAIHLNTGYPTGLSVQPSWSIQGENLNGLFGAKVEAVGDLNGDGFADMAVGEHGWSGTDGGLGRVHIYSGNSTLESDSVTIEGHADDLILGWAILGVGDSNGDGFADLVIGSSRATTDLSGRGRAQVHSGSSSGISTSANRVWSMSETWTLFGHTLNALGDIDDDGYDDLAVSEISNNSLWIFKGSATGFGQNPAQIISGSDGFGYSVVPAGDVNDDGILDLLIGKPASGTAGGSLQLLPGTNASDLFDTQSPFFSQSGGSNQHLGRILASGGDADRDGTHEFLYASATAMADGTAGGSIVLFETRDWELSDLPFDFTVDAIDLAVDAQGRTQLLLDTDEGVFHYERANEGLSSSDPWRSTAFGSLAASGMVVTPAGQPILVGSDGSGLDFHRREGGILLQTTLANSGDVGKFGSLVLSADNRPMTAYASAGSAVIFSNLTESGLTTSVVVTSQTIDTRILLLLNESGTPHILWRDANQNDIELAVQDGANWLFKTLENNANGDHFDAVMAANGSIGLIVRTGSQGLVTQWHEGTGSSWSKAEQVTLSVINTNANGNFAASLDSTGDLLVQWQDNVEMNHLESVIGGIGTEIDLPVMNDTVAPSLFFEDTAGSHLLLPGELVGTTGTHVLISPSGNRTISLDCELDSIEILVDADGATNVLCEDSTGRLSISVLDDSMQPPIRLSTLSITGPPAAAIDGNGTWHILVYTSGSRDALLLVRMPDSDRDFVPDFVDDLPNFGGQWNDQDGDGFGDNADAPSVDRCPSLAGTSTYGHHGCADADGDGFANAIDDCSDSGKSWRDRLGCDDTDGDGWSDPGSGGPGWNGDRHPTNWMQSVDTDGDGRYDNHGPDCCGQNANSDEFPLDPQQWEDLDGDGWGDNSSAPTGDKCPGTTGSSIHDRGGCPDSDGDGWSDPEAPSTQNPEGWTYNRSRCASTGQHCADLWPWGPDDISPENTCGDRCDEQWGDRDGDGYGDNSSYGAWRRDAFPYDPTQHTDTDEDGWGDNSSGNNPDDCPGIWGNSTADRRGCLDTDGDGHSNNYSYDINSETGLRENELGDALPNDPNQWRDRDGDGFGESGQGDLWDRCPTVPGFLAGEPGPGCPLPEGDEDGDGVLDENDQCPDTPQTELADLETGCSVSQTDSDGDGVFDDVDICPNTPLGETANALGCSASQTDIDTDADGVNDIDGTGQLLDLCPNTNSTTPADENGCAAYQRDGDQDLVMDDVDLCPNTTPGASVDAVGCVQLGVDQDGDDHDDDVDAFPQDATQWADTDGDRWGDNWADASWTASREGSVGQWFLNATTPDACPETNGASDQGGIYGCLDSDGDGWADPVGAFVAHPDGQADAFPQNATQWADTDGDGFGDNDPGFKADKCVNTPGVAGGNPGDGCPLPYVPPPDEDDDGVPDSRDDCRGTENRHKDMVDVNGCSESQLEDQEEESTPLMEGPLKYVAMALGVILLIAIVLLVIGRIRSGGVDWDDDDLLDDDDDEDYDDDDDDDWSPFGASQSSPSTSPGFSSPSRGPPGGGQGPPAESRGPPGASRGPPQTSDFGATSSSPPSSPAMRPGGRPPQQQPASPEPAPAATPATAPVKRTRRTAPQTESTDRPVRKTRRTSKPAAVQEDGVPVRRTRKTAKPARKSRRRKVGDAFDELFSAGEKVDFDSAVAFAKERTIVGDSDRSVLSRLQAEGWSVKQSKHILGHAKR